MIKNRIRQIIEIVQSSDRKSIPRIAMEIIDCTLREEEIPGYYFSHYLYRTDTGSYRDYVGFRAFRKIMREVHWEGGRRNVLLKNKILFYMHMKSGGIAELPELHAYNCGHMVFASNGEIERVGNPQHLRRCISRLAHKTQGRAIFVKPIDSQGGVSCYKFTENGDQSSDQESCEELFDKMRYRYVLFQESLLQHESISEIYPWSINTLRITTCKYSIDNIRVGARLMRFGNNGSVTDNRSSGGLFVPVNDGGLLGEYGYTSTKKSGRRFERHPVTGVQFSGRKVPFVYEAEAICLRAAKLIQNSVVGWDVAITPNGPVVLEGNDNPDLTMNQMVCRGFRADAVFGEFYGKCL